MNTLATPTEPFRHADLDGRPAPEPAFPTAGPDQRTVSGPAAQAFLALRKAWACDDAGDVVPASIERTRAAWFLRMAIRDGSPVNGHVSADFALLADLLRRSGDFGGAVAVARRGLAAGPPEGVGALLHFQLQLAAAGDEERHDLGEALAGRRAG